METIKLSELETKRFGIVCAKVVAADQAKFDLGNIDREARDAGVAMLSVRVDVLWLDCARAFENAGFRLMDTLLYYSRPLGTPLAPPQWPEGVILRSGTPEDAEAVGAIARRAFSGYLGHYHMDPRLDDAAATEAYADWAANILRRGDEAETMFVAFDEGSLAGFLALRRNSAEEVEITLNAIDPGRQRRGIYAALLAEALQWAGARGVERMIVSTQISNYSVQRVWSRYGFVHDRSFYTFHKWFDTPSPDLVRGNHA